MKNTLLLLSAAAAFTLASCSENKPAETVATTTDTMTTTTTSTSMDYSPEAVNSRADRMASDMATSMQLDEPTRTRVRDIYATRGQRMAELNQKYMTDTMGMAAARRDVYSNTDAEMKTVFTNPTQYSAYESSRSTYMDDRYMGNDNMSSGTMNSSDNMNMTEADKIKMKGEDGGKLKVKADGDVKIKDSEGNKAKMDADDGTVKMKPVDGENTVIK